MTTDFDFTPDVAPYRDPDGYRSWQPDPAARAKDAWHRRMSHARTARSQARKLAVAVSVLVDHCGADMTLGTAQRILDADLARCSTIVDAVTDARP